MSLKEKVIASVVALAVTAGFSYVALQPEPTQNVRPAYDGYLCKVVIGWAWDSIHGGYKPIYDYRWCRIA